MEWKISAVNRGDVPVILKAVKVQDYDTTLNLSMAGNQLVTLQHKQPLSFSTPLTQPYWLQRPHGLDGYKIPDGQLISKPENDPPVTATFTFSIAGREVILSRPLVYKFTDPVRGEVYRPLEVSPPITVNIDQPLYVFNTTQSREIKVRLKSGIDNAKGSVSLKAPAAWKVSPASNSFELRNKGDEAMVTFSVVPASSTIREATDTMKAFVEMNGQTYDRGTLTISYDHIPAITIYPIAQTKLVSVPLEIRAKNIGYINGAGDLIPDMLRQIGYKVTTLSDDDIANGDLQQYDAIITGVRLYNTNERIKYLNGKLLDYVKNGGNLVVQYNTTSNLLVESPGPFPFKISGDRVTDEHAAVTFLKPDNPVLNVPNKITGADFNGWIQERGLYFVSEADGSYQKILAMNDKGEQPLDGSLIVCNYGKGRYIYTGLSFFRELPAGVPGAFRLFVNLISK